MKKLEIYCRIYIALFYLTSCDTKPTNFDAHRAHFNSIYETVMG